MKQMSQIKMKQTKIEIAIDCFNCPVSNLDSDYDDITYCSFYKKRFSIPSNRKPDFCKVKNIIVQED